MNTEQDKAPVAETAGERFAYVSLDRGSYPDDLIDHLNGFITGGSSRCREALEARGVVITTVPAQDDDKLRTLADRVTAEVKRGADGSHVQALGALSNIEGLVSAALKSTAAQEGGSK